MLAAYNTAMTIAGENHTDTTQPGHLTIRLDPLPTHAKTTMVAEHCIHLNSIQTRCRGTDFILRYAINIQDRTNTNKSPTGVLDIMTSSVSNYVEDWTHRQSTI